MIPRMSLFWQARDQIILILLSGIFSDPDYPPEEVYGPYNNLQIKCKYFPIETKLDYTQVPLILQDLEPKLLMLPEQYTKPVKGVSGRDLVVAYVSVARKIVAWSIFAYND